MCSPWQQWKEASVWFDDSISAFHSCAVVRMSEPELEQRTNIKFLLSLARVEAKSEMLLQVYGDNAMKKTAVYKFF
jgi:hypothetical protein